MKVGILLSIICSLTRLLLSCICIGIRSFCSTYIQFKRGTNFYAIHVEPKLNNNCPPDIFDGSIQLSALAAFCYMDVIRHSLADVQKRKTLQPFSSICSSLKIVFLTAIFKLVFCWVSLQSQVFNYRSILEDNVARF